MSEPKFYICEHCGNIVGKINDAGVPLMCCGQKMKELVPGTVEASTEKHGCEAGRSLRAGVDVASLFHAAGGVDRRRDERDGQTSVYDCTLPGANHSRQNASGAA